jgi:hypothetical protein
VIVPVRDDVEVFAATV